MVWFLTSAFPHFPQEREGPDGEEAVLLCLAACAGCAGELLLTELRIWFLCLCAVTGALAVQQMYVGRRDGDEGQEAEQCCVVSAQECAGLGRAWISSHAAPSHSMS